MEMSDLFLLYLFTRLDILQGLFTFFTVVLGIVNVVLTAVVLFEGINSPTVRGRLRWLWIGFVVAVLGTAAIPSKADMAVIVGGKFAIDIARSDKAAVLGNALYQWALEQIQENRKEKK